MEKEEEIELTGLSSELKDYIDELRIPNLSGVSKWQFKRRV